ncbi:MAG: carbohydrate ABC transporter permease [Frankiaceae bacterium]
MTTSTATPSVGVRRTPDPQPDAERDRSERRLATLLLVPTLVLLGVVVGAPILRALWLSLFTDDEFGDSKFAGLHQYVRALTGKGASDFWSAWAVTSEITFVSLVLELALGMAMALIMHRAFRGRGLIRTSVLVPWAIPTAVTALLWQWMFQPTGVINAITGRHTIWTGSHWPSMWAIIIADVWKTAPFIGLLLLAGLQIIPDELYEAAKVDGASTLQRFRRITLPLLRNAILVAVLFRMLDVLRIFDLPYILTHGANNTTTLSIYAFNESIRNLHTHYGSALSTLTFLYILLVATLFIKLMGASVVQSQSKAVR